MILKYGIFSITCVKINKMQSLINATTDDPFMMSEIVLVISNRPGVEDIKHARRAGLLALVI